ncbi:MAG: ATP-dependent endonuclease [bacterium]|nr:ATP-dependent endonuclease [bacterium]
MKYKFLNDEQIILSLDRLTRFKNTKDKYLRVFSDIICDSLIEPQIRRNDIEKLNYTEIASIVTEIFNNSVEKKSKPDYSINTILKDYENAVFCNDFDTQKLLDNKIDYKNAISILGDNCPINLLWLKKIALNPVGYKENEKETRCNSKLKFPIEKIILVEGVTEEILLPAFSRYLGFDFYEKGVQIIAAGGKNQVVKLYYKLTEELKLPIFILLDKDAEENIKQIQPKLRNIDSIHLLYSGEFEDLLPHSLITKTVNLHFENFLNITEDDLNKETSTAKALEVLFKTKGLHEFKKAEFAKLVKENINNNSDISEEIANIINEIFYNK